jgi:hypothetical protein
VLGLDGKVSKVVPVDAMKAYVWNGGPVPYILNIDNINRYELYTLAALLAVRME